MSLKYEPASELQIDNLCNSSSTAIRRVEEISGATIEMHEIDCRSSFPPLEMCCGTYRGGLVFEAHSLLYHSA